MKVTLEAAIEEYTEALKAATVKARPLTRPRLLTRWQLAAAALSIGWCGGVIYMTVIYG